MGKKLIQASAAKICKPDKKQFNSLINILKPKVYITDASNFKKLVQELTGNGNPISYNPPPIHQEPPVMNLMQVPPTIDIIDDDQEYQEHSFGSCVDSSEASFPTSFAASESSADVYETFDVLESSFVNATSSNMNNKNIIKDFPDCGDIESWLLEIDNYTFNYDHLIGDCLPVQQQEVSVYGYGFSDLI